MKNKDLFGTVEPKYGKGKVNYSHEEFIEAHNAWKNGKEFEREREWNTYCDIRDGFSLGFTQSQEDELKKKHKLNRDMLGFGITIKQ